MNDQPHDEQREPVLPPETPPDAGAQALAEALRSSFAIVRLLLVVLVVLFCGSGFFKVREQERAIILHLGKPVGEGTKALLGPGLHWSYPYPIDEYVKVPITEIQKVNSSVGWFFTTAEQEMAGTEPPAAGSINPAVDSYVLTADGNIIHTRATLYYRIDDPVSYVFNFANASNVVQNALNNALVSTAARFPVDEILTRDVTGFKEAVRRRATELIDKQKVGVIVQQCDVESRPPRQLKEAFAGVLRAEVTRSKVLNEASTYENQVLNKANADAKSRINSAEGDRARLVNEVSSRADEFLKLLPQYRANPNLFVQQRLTETLGRVFTNAQDKIFIQESADGKSRELRLLLNRELPKLKTEETPK
jgi:membrane protease subunit HflK